MAGNENEIHKLEHDDTYHTKKSSTWVPDGTGNLVRLGANSLNLPAYDYMSRTLTNSTTETYTYKTGGASGTTVATVTIVYTDSTLATISSVTKS